MYNQQGFVQSPQHYHEQSRPPLQQALFPPRVQSLSPLYRLPPRVSPCSLCCSPWNQQPADQELHITLLDQTSHRHHIKYLGPQLVLSEENVYTYETRTCFCYCFQACETLCTLRVYCSKYMTAYGITRQRWINTLNRRQNSWYVPNDIFNCTENWCVLIEFPFSTFQLIIIWHYKYIHRSVIITT